jgi:DNA polymerase-3 subunit epsilon
MDIWKEEVIGIVDIETTDFLAKGGKIVEVGIAGLHLPTGNVFKLFHTLCREPGLTQKDQGAWIFQNSSLRPEDIREAPMLEDVRAALQATLHATKANTAFNKTFDFDFLRSRSFDVGNEWNCPMKVATDVCKVPSKNGRKGYKWPTVEEAWAYFFPDVPYVEEHRGLDDAIHESRIVYELYKQGLMK